MIGMSTTSPSAPLMTAAAREALGPLGLQRRGRSRIWLDDHDWWLGVVEFQPGSNEGSYLNVGVMWLWQVRAHLAYDIGGRDGAFERFVNPTQFAQDIGSLASRAAVVVAENRGRFSTLRSTASFLTSQEPQPGSFWDNYHAAVAAALVGDSATARLRFARVLAEDAFAPWMVEAQEMARQLHDLAGDIEVFRERATEMTSSCRQLLNLPPCEVVFGDR